MKKVLSLVLVLVLALGMTTVAFAALTTATDNTAITWDLVRGEANTVSLPIPVSDSSTAAATFAVTATSSGHVVATMDAFLAESGMQASAAGEVEFTITPLAASVIPNGTYLITATLTEASNTITYTNITVNVTAAPSGGGTVSKVPSNWKITGFSEIATANWDADVASSIDIGEKKNELPITAEMFDWEYKEGGNTYKVLGSELGTAAAKVKGVKVDATLTSSQLSNVGVRRVYQKGTANTIKSADIKDSDSLVEVKTVKFYAKTGATDVELKLALTFKSKTSDIIVANYAFEMKNAEETIEAGQNLAYSYGNYILKAEDTVRDVEFETDEDGIVYMTKTVVKGQKYYANVTSELEKSDEQIIADNPEVDSIYNAYTVNMANATVQFKNLDREYFVYDAAGKLLGTTKDKKLPLATKYILTTAKVDFGGEEVEEEPVEETPDVDAPPMGGGEVEAPSNNYNPNTGL